MLSDLRVGWAMRRPPNTWQKNQNHDVERRAALHATGVKLVGGTKLHSRRVTTSERELDCSELRAAIGQIEMGRLRWIVCRDDFVILRE